MHSEQARIVYVIGHRIPDTDSVCSAIGYSHFKEFIIGNRKLGVSQMMVLDCEEIDLREGELLDELERIRNANNYDLTALLVINPLSSRQERVMLKGETWIVEKAFHVKVDGDTCVLPGILSRKRDFISAIGRALSISGG